MILRFNHNKLNIFLEYITRQPDFINQQQREDYYQLLKDYNEDNGYEITALEKRTKIVFVFAILNWSPLGNGNEDYEFFQLEVTGSRDRNYYIKQYYFNQIVNEDYISDKETPEQDPYNFYLQNAKDYDEGFFKDFNLDNLEILYHDDLQRQKWENDTSLRKAFLRVVDRVFVEVVDNYYEDMRR